MNHRPAGAAAKSQRARDERRLEAVCAVSLSVRTSSTQILICDFEQALVRVNPWPRLWDRPGAKLLLNASPPYVVSER